MVTKSVLNLKSHALHCSCLGIYTYNKFGYQRSVFIQIYHQTKVQVHTDTIIKSLNISGPMRSNYWWEHFVSGFVSMIGDSIPTPD